jgi:ABC-type Fe3+-hydroxamate transport system substrate-binding protein
LLRILTASALILLAACGRAPDANGDGNAASSASDIPIYPGANTNGGAAIDNSAAHVRTFTTPDMPAQVVQYYGGAAVRAGYKVDSQIDMGDSGAVVARRTSGDTLQMTARRIGDVTRVQLIETPSAH